MSSYKNLKTADGVRIDALHAKGERGLGIVVAHGFTGSWRRPSMRRVTPIFQNYGGVIGFDELWLEKGFGHAGNAAPDELIRRIGDWLVSTVIGSRRVC